MVDTYAVATALVEKLNYGRGANVIVEYANDGAPDVPCVVVGVTEESVLTTDSDGLFTLTATIRAIYNYSTDYLDNLADRTQTTRTLMLAIVGTTLDGNLVAGVVPVSVSSTELLDTGGDTLMAQTSTYRIFIEQQD